MATKEKLIYARGRWEIASVERNQVTGKDQWIRRDSSYICDVGAEKAAQDLPPKP